MSSARSLVESGLSWLGSVPQDWRVTPLRYLVDFRSGGTPSKDREDFWNGDIPWASAKDLKSDVLFDTIDHLDDAAISVGGVQLIPENSVVVLVRGMMLARTFPAVKLAVDMAINQDLKGLLPRPGVDAGFLAWALRGTTRETLNRLDEAGHGTKALRMEAWVSMQIAVPTETEQVAIAAFLDRETAKIDALVEAQRRLIELLKEKRQAAISHAVTKGLDPSAPMKDSGFEWLGQVPAHWEVLRLKDLVTPVDGIQMGPFGGMLKDLLTEPTDFKVYGQENVTNGDFGRGSRWIDAKRFSELGAYQLRVGDFMLTRKGSVGNCCMFPDTAQRGIIDSDTIRISLAPSSLDRRFALRILHEASYVSTQIDLTKRGAILAGLNTTVVSNLVVATPPLHEQIELVAHLDAETAKFDALVVQSETAITLLQERRAALISAAVTGKIDVRGLVKTAEAA